METVVSERDFGGAWRGRRVLVTGHTGFKGSWLTLWLQRLGANVTGFSDCVPTEPSHFEALGLDVDDRRGDIADADAVARLVNEAQPEIVFHLAAQPLVRRAYADPIGTYRANVIGTLSLFEACRAQGGVAAIVSATTDKVYRNREWERGYREDDALGGADPYSASKSCVELMTESYRASYLGGPAAMRIASVRAGNVIGGGDWAEDRLIPDLVRAQFEGRAVSIRHPDATRPWQHVLDPLAGYLELGARLLAGDDSAAEAWNFGPEAKASIRVRDIVAALQRQLPAVRADYARDPGGPHEAGLLQLDSAKATARLGWRPRWESEMIERTVEWYRAFYEEGRVISADQLDAFCAAAG